MGLNLVILPSGDICQYPKLFIVVTLQGEVLLASSEKRSEMPLSIYNAQASPCNKELSICQMSIVPKLRNNAIDSNLSLSKIMSPKFSNFPCRELYSQNVLRF